MEDLEKLFGSVAKVKLMKLFLLNSQSIFELDEIKKRSNVTAKSVRKELSTLEKIGFVKIHSVQKKKKVNGKTKKESKSVKGWSLNPNFKYLEPLKNLLVFTNSFKSKDVLKKFNKAGAIKLIVISGVFIQEWETRIDIMIVGDNLKMNNLNSVLRTLESEVGKELKYSIFETEDFKYRLTMCDKLVRDILDFPHQKILNRLDI